MNNPVELDHGNPGRATCLNLGIDPESTIGKIICGQARRIETSSAYADQYEIELGITVTALSKIMERANKVYQMGDAEARRALADCYNLAKTALDQVQP
jgi:hypothetical protein